MTAMRKKSKPAAGFGDERALHLRVAAERRQRGDERGPDELRLLGLQRGQQRGRHRGLRVRREPAVGHLAHAIVAVAHQAAHQVGRPRIVEGRQQHERAIADELVGDACAPPRPGQGQPAAAGTRLIARAAFIRVA